MDDSILKFDLPKNQSSYIKVIGLGGGGSNAVNYMYEQGIQGVDFIVCNTDAAALDGSPVPTKIQLGKGLGAGNVPAVAEKAAQEKAEEIKSLFLGNTQMVFITAGMGGGTGTGAAPVVAQLLKEIDLEDDDVKKILTVAVVTTPFSIEGRKRKEQALEGIESLRQQVDSILIINNDKLKEYGDLSMREAFALVNEILSTAVKGISEIITVRSNIQIDFRDVNTVMSNSGVALMGCGSASGENRAVEAVKQAVNSPLLNDCDIFGAKNVLLYIASSSEHEITMTEFDEMTHFIKKTTGHDVDVIWGAGVDESLGEKLNVTLVATGFSKKEIFQEPVKTVIQLEDEPARIFPTPAAVPAEAPAPAIAQAPVAPSPRYVLDEEPMGQLVVPVEAMREAPSENFQKIVFDDSHSPEIAQTKMHESYSTNDAWDDIQLVTPKRTEDALSEAVKNLAEERAQTAPRIEESANEPNLVPNTEKWQRNSADRARQLRELSAMTKTAEGLETLEKVPAYLRRNVTMVEPTRSTDHVMPQYGLSDDGRVVSNSFLNNNVD